MDELNVIKMINQMIYHYSGEDIKYGNLPIRIFLKDNISVYVNLLNNNILFSGSLCYPSNEPIIYYSQLPMIDDKSISGINLESIFLLRVGADNYILSALVELCNIKDWRDLFTSLNSFHKLLVKF